MTLQRRVARLIVRGATGSNPTWVEQGSVRPLYAFWIEVRIGSQGKSKLRDTLAKIIEQRFGSGPFRVTNVATVGCGVVG